MGLVQANIETGIETSPQLMESLHLAREMALKANVAEVLPVHLTIAMLEDDESSFLLEAYGVNFDKVRTQLIKLARMQAQPMTSDSHAVFSLAIEALMRHAREQAQKNGLGEVDGNLILAIVLSQDAGFMAKMLRPYDLDASGVLQYLELREGKTVDIEPLPATTNAPPRPANVAPAPVPNNKPQSQPAPVSAPRPAPSNAPMGSPPGPQPGRPPAPLNNRQNPPPGPSAVNIQAGPVNPNPAAQPTGAMAPNPAPPAPDFAKDSGLNLVQASTAAAGAPAPMPNQARAKSAEPAAGQRPVNAGQNNAPAPVSRAQIDSAAAAASTTPDAAVPAAASNGAPDAAPSRFRSMVSGLGKAFKSKATDAQIEEEAISKQLPSETPAAPPPIAANNNQTAVSKGPITQSVEHLVNQPVPAPQQTGGDGPTFAQTAQYNRPAKRRRAIPSSLDATQSISATGSVLEKGRLVENVPRRMKLNKPSKAEVRITRAQMEEITSEFDDLSDSHIHELAVTEAMTVQLRAPGSGFHIENLSPQTQWIDRNQRHIHDADFGVWRWNVTPTKSGKARLQLVISARTVDDEGTIHIADIPDKIIELGVYRDHAQMFKRAGILTVVAITGLTLGRYGEIAYQWLKTLASQIG